MSYTIHINKQVAQTTITMDGNNHMITPLEQSQDSISLTSQNFQLAVVLSGADSSAEVQRKRGRPSKQNHYRGGGRKKGGSSSIWFYARYADA